MSRITELDLARFSQELARGDRAAFYLDYYNVTGVNQALTLAQISSFSGVAGQAAAIANDIDAALWSRYPAGGVNSFSLAIAQDIFRLISDDVARGGTGIMANSQLVNSAQSTWQRLGVGDLFPGNALVAMSLFSGDTAYLNSHVDDFFTPGFFVGGVAGIVPVGAQSLALTYSQT